MMTPSKRVIQPASQEAYKPRLHRGIGGTSWWTVCFPSSLSGYWLTNEVFPSWFSVISAQISLGGSWPLLELVRLPIGDSISGKEENKDKSDDYVNIRDISEGPGYLYAGFWFKKANLFCSIYVLQLQPTVQLSVPWISNFLTFISWHLSHSARLFSTDAE